MSDWHQAHSAYLLTEHWFGLRAQCFKKAGNRCEACRGKKSLEGHHLVYRAPLESCTLADIMALCHRCHTAWHQWLQKEGQQISAFNREQTATQIRSNMCHGSPRKHRRKKNKHAVAMGASLPRAGVLQPRSKIDILETVVFEQSNVILRLGERIKALEARLFSGPFPT